MEKIPPKRWHHVSRASNPADCASRGLYPSELVNHTLWWEGPVWLRLPESDWPTIPEIGNNPIPEEERSVPERSLIIIPVDPILLYQISSLTRLHRITAWMRRFINNCRTRKEGRLRSEGFLTIKELAAAEEMWLALAQQQAFAEEIGDLKVGKEVGKRLLPLRR